MAFLHCHNCDWSQDDFWDFSFGRYGYWRIPFTKISWSYNPISCFMSHVFDKKGYWFPRRIQYDRYCIEDLGWKRADPHSWWLIWYQFKRMLRKFKRQKWRTEKAFRRDRILKLAYCPSCGSRDHFDID